LIDKRSNTTQWDLVPHQQDGFVRLWHSVLNAYINLLRIPFSFYQMDTNGTEAATQQAKQLAEQATQRAIEAATQQAKQLAEQATLPVAEAAGRDTATNTEEERRLHLHEEQLQVHKRPIETGKVRLSKEVVTEQKTINVPVTREEMVIEHRPASGQVSDMPIGEGETIRIPLSEEQVTVSKQTVEKGEVALGKRQVQETQQVSDTVRREEARIEHEGHISIQESDLDESTQQPEH
jgi:uncharacterized protein (TIGR02271 family)